MIITLERPSEKPAEKPLESRNAHIPSQQSSQNEEYFSYAHRLQNEESVESIEMEETRGEIQEKFNEFLRAISEESSQLSEFLLEERKLTHELCSLLTQILRRLNISLNVSPKYLTNLGSAREIKLNSEGHLIIIREDDKVDSRRLDDYHPDVIVTVMWIIIPELEKAIKAYRKKISKRINLLEKIKQELRNIQKAFSPDQGESYEQLKDQGIRRPLITSEP